jgi:hypothetical protein
MHDEHKITHVMFEGRQFQVIHAYQYEKEQPFDVWLRDAETGQFTHSCCEGIDGFLLGEHELLIRDKYFGVLEDAGVVKRIGESFEVAGRGTLHKCDVAAREQVPDEYEWIEFEAAKVPAVADTVREAVTDAFNHFGHDAVGPDDGKNPYRLAREDSPRVFFEGRERRVIFAAFDIGDFVDIWLTDAETDKITHCCTEIDRGSRIDEYEVLVRDEFMSILMDAGVLQPRGEVVMKDFSMLHRCKMLERGFIAWLDRWEDFAEEVDEKSTSPVSTLEDNSTPVQADRDLADRDLGDEFEL